MTCSCNSSCQDGDLAISLLPFYQGDQGVPGELDPVQLARIQEALDTANAAEDAAEAATAAAQAVTGDLLDPAKGDRLMVHGSTTLHDFILNSVGKVVSSVAELYNLDPTLYTKAFVLGYYQIGDGGGLGPVRFEPASVAVINGGSVTGSYTGSGRWHMCDTKRMNPLQFGARADFAAGGTNTDDTLKIQACYNAIESGGTMYIPIPRAEGYLISNQGGHCLNFSRNVNVIGEGQRSIFVPADGTTVSTIRIKPIPNDYNSGLQYRNFALGNPINGTRQGLHGILVDTTVNASNLAKPIFDQLFIYDSANTAGYAICHLNDPLQNPNGGMYGAEITSCRSLGGGLYFGSTGDSTLVDNCIITGKNQIYASLINAGDGPASVLIIRNCNVTTTNGTLKVDNGSSVKFINNNCEQRVPFQAGALYMIDISSNDGTTARVEIRGNQLGIFSGVTNAGVVRFNNCRGGIFTDNDVRNSNASANGVVITASEGIYIGMNSWGSAITNRVVDTSGTGSMGFLKNMSGFVNSWNHASGNVAQFMKSHDGVVFLNGAVASGVANTGITTLPSGFRPNQTVRFVVVTSTGPGTIQIDTAGNILQLSGGTGLLCFDGVSFPAAGTADIATA